MFNTKEEIAKAFAEIAFPLHECMTKASTEIYHNPDKRIINTPELRTRYFKRVLAEYLSMEFTGEIQTDLAKGKQGRPTLVHVPSGAWIPFRAAQGLRRNESSARRAVTSALFGRGQLDDLRGSKAKAEYDPAFPFGALAFEYPPVDEEGHPVVPWQLAFVKCYPSSTLESGRFQYRLPIRANDDFSTMSRGFQRVEEDFYFLAEEAASFGDDQA